MADTRALEAARREKMEKGKILLATNLEQGFGLGFLTFEDIIRHVNTGNYFARGLVILTKLIDFRQIVGPLYDNMEHEDDRNVMIGVWAQALKGELPFYEELLAHIPVDKLSAILQHWVTDDPQIVTWANLVAAFPFRDLSACAAEGLNRAEILGDSPEVEVIDETAEPPTEKPTD